MPLLDEYSDRYDKSPEDPAKKILFAVVNDLTGRSGFDGIWDGMQKDDQEELLNTNLRKIQKQMS
jgi:hypothetical protein